MFTYLTMIRIREEVSNLRTFQGHVSANSRTEEKGLEILKKRG
jgi:hypothetical protein